MNSPKKGTLQVLHQKDGGVSSVKIQTEGDQPVSTVVWDLSSSAQDSDDEWNIGQAWIVAKQVAGGVLNLG